MAAPDTLGTVSDRCVGGMMFHSAQADLCRWLGVRWLASMHEDGYHHDSKALRKVRRACIAHCGVMVPEGRQERGHALDAYRSCKRWDVRPDVRAQALKDSVSDWVEWESSTVAILTSAYRRLEDQGEPRLAKVVRGMAEDTQSELAGARDVLCELEGVCWDMSHVMARNW